MYIPPEIEGQEAGVAQIAGIMKFLTYHEVNTVVARLVENIRDGNVQETKLNFALYFELVEDDLKHYLKKINYDQITETQKETLYNLRKKKTAFIFYVKIFIFILFVFFSLFFGSPLHLNFFVFIKVILHKKEQSILFKLLESLFFLRLDGQAFTDQPFG